MQRKVIYELNALYREPMRVTGYAFGDCSDGEKTVCVVGSMRGNEVQQMYACSRLIQRLKKLEEQRAVAEEKHSCHSVCQFVLHEYREAFLVNGQYGHQPHVSRIQRGGDDAAHRGRRV